MIRGGIAQEQDGVLFRHDDDAIFVPWDAPPALHEAAYRTLFGMERQNVPLDPTQLTHASEDDDLWFDLVAVIQTDKQAIVGFDFAYLVWGGIVLVLLMAVAYLIWEKL